MKASRSRAQTGGREEASAGQQHEHLPHAGHRALELHQRRPSPALSLRLPSLIEAETPLLKTIQFCCSILQMGQNRPHLAQIGKGLPQG